ncbi:hypothetical protein V6N13_051897 [Hibiscus sabdariffa]
MHTLSHDPLSWMSPDIFVGLIIQLMIETKPDVEDFSGRHKRHPCSQQLKSRFDLLEDLDHPLPLYFRSTCMRWLAVVND